MIVVSYDLLGLETPSVFKLSEEVRVSTNCLVKKIIVRISASISIATASRLVRCDRNQSITIVATTGTVYPPGILNDPEWKGTIILKLIRPGKSLFGLLTQFETFKFHPEFQIFPASVTQNQLV